MSYTKDIEALSSVVGANSTWKDINPESAVRMRLQQRQDHA
jgi:isocitrate lyase